MSIDIAFAVLAGTSPDDVFAAVLRAVNAPDGATWRQHNFGDMQMLQAKPEQGADALVSVHYPTAGGVYAEDDSFGRYLTVGLTTGWHCDDPECREDVECFRPLITAVCDALTGLGLPFVWTFEEDLWRTPTWNISAEHLEY